MRDAIQNLSTTQSLALMRKGATASLLGLDVGYSADTQSALVQPYPQDNHMTYYDRCKKILFPPSFSKSQLLPL